MLGRAYRNRAMRPAIVVISLLVGGPGFAWEGTDTGTGNTVEIEKGQTVREGREIEVYDYGSGSYRSVDVDSVRQSGGSVEIEGTDSSGKSVILEMELN